MEHNIAVGRKAWLVFGAIQAIGCIFAGYGTMYSESVFVRGSWLVGFFMLLPGNLPAIAVGQMLIHVRTAYVFFPLTVACNALLWIVCRRLWRMLRATTPMTSRARYAIAMGATGLGFVVMNTIHFLRPVTCWDCFFRYGLPFTLYQAGGYGGGAGLVWAGLAADVACLVAVSVLIGCIWTFIARPRVNA